MIRNYLIVAKHAETSWGQEESASKLSEKQIVALSQFEYVSTKW